MHLDDVGCTGSENALTSCFSRDFGDVSSNCRSHLEDACAVCSSGGYDYDLILELLTVSFSYIDCPDRMFMCHDGRIDGQQPPCISSEQRCDNVTDCIGGEDELDHNCPCGPEGAIRLVDSIVAHRGRVDFCRNGVWSAICSLYYYSWSTSDAAVVCHQLGYPRAGMNLIMKIIMPCTLSTVLVQQELKHTVGSL